MNSEEALWYSMCVLLAFLFFFFKAADSTKNSTRFIAFALSPQTQHFTVVVWLPPSFALEIYMGGPEIRVSGNTLFNGPY